MCYYSHVKSACFQQGLLVSAVWEGPAGKVMVILGCLCERNLLGGSAAFRAAMQERQSVIWDPTGGTGGAFWTLNPLCIWSHSIVSPCLKKKHQSFLVATCCEWFISLMAVGKRTVQHEFQEEREKDGKVTWRKNVNWENCCYSEQSLWPMKDMRGLPTSLHCFSGLMTFLRVGKYECGLGRKLWSPLQQSKPRVIISCIWTWANLDPMLPSYQFLLAKSSCE